MLSKFFSVLERHSFEGGGLSREGTHLRKYCISIYFVLALLGGG